jgi:hypothetical protein
MFANCDGVILWIGVGHRLNVLRAIGGGLCLLCILPGNLMGPAKFLYRHSHSLGARQ